MGANCEQCHTVNGWNVSVQAIQNHFNRFPLLGAHASLQCDDCHKGAATGQFQGLSTACYSCHAKDFQSTQTLGGSVPNHVSAHFPTACEQCHRMNTWADVNLANFDHSAPPISFPLTFGHANVACTACHIGGNYNLQIQASQCGTSGCHVTTWQQTTNPVHSAAGPSFALGNCANCHTTAGWMSATATFNHATTGFPLTGFHATSVPCAGCHINNNYNLTVATCVSCHLANYQATTNPNHVQAAFPQTCEGCHNTSAWTGAVFNHASTGFALTVMHVSPTPTPCISCHVNNNYTLTSAACITCHAAQYQSTATLGGVVPNHITAAFPTDCSLCHSTSAWTGAVFNHAATGFPLTGFHATSVPCAGCHVNNNYALTSAACINCHAAAYQSTTTLGGAVPNHVAAAFPTDCTLCHTTTAWTGAVFNHNATAFPLTGFHATSVPCASCHVNNNYTTLPVTCIGCHATDYNGTTNPAHAAAGFPTTCATCHTTTAWTGATFSHPFFALTHGRNAANGVCSVCHTNPANYAVFQCTQCHGGGNAANFRHPGVGGYVYNSVNCYQCHRNAQ